MQYLRLLLAIDLIFCYYMLTRFVGTLLVACDGRAVINFKKQQAISFQYATTIAQDRREVSFL